jgi:hypothetical protein
MDSARNTPDSQDSDDLSHERHQHPPASTLSETWNFSSVAPAPVSGGDSPVTVPQVSLFSPSVPAILPTAAPEVGTGSTRAHVSAYGPPSSSRSPLPSLGSVANMSKRTARLKVSGSHPPIVQLHTQIPQAQKSGDDPTTPLDNTGRKRTTMDRVSSEQTTMTSLSKLFSDTTMSGSRAPSYNNATGPLYLRGMLH